MLADELSEDEEENAMDDKNWGWFLCFLLEALVFVLIWMIFGFNVVKIWC
jgi:hypothetical protein